MRRNAFSKRTRSTDLFSKLSLTYIAIGVMLTIIKVFIILFLLCLWEQGAPFKIFESSGQNLLNSSCQFWNEKSIPVFKFLDKRIPSKCQFWHFQALWWKFAKFLMSFSKPQVSFSSKFAYCSVSWKITPLYFCSSNIIYFGRKEPIKTQIFSSAQVKSSSC